MKTKVSEILLSTFSLAHITILGFPQLREQSPSVTKAFVDCLYSNCNLKYFVNWQKQGDYQHGHEM